jgi:large subunit ribosomal protein L6
MSRIGKKPIEIPAGVEVKLEGDKAVIKGPKGTLYQEIKPEIKIDIRNGQIFVLAQKNTKQISALQGTTRALLSNKIKGVTQGFEKRLEIQGIGYRAAVEGQDLVLNVGFTHQVRIKASDDIKFTVEKNIIIVSGNDKEKVTQLAAKIKKVRPPEPYKGKGIRYVGEIVKRKIGKKAVATTK